MEEIYIIEEQGFQFFNDGGSYVSIPYPSDENLLEDYHFHDWIVQVFDNFNPPSLVIPLSIWNDRFLGLMLGMHIRLNNQLNHSQRTIPIVFISNEFTYESIFSDIDLEIKNNRAFPHYLLTTPNIYLESPDLKLIREIVQLAKPMTVYEYYSKFLHSIKINPSEATGKHSIANIWGAFQLAKTTGFIEMLSSNSKLLKYQKDLYFKYIQAISLEGKELDSTSRKPTPPSKEAEALKLTIEARNKNILFIDDEADKGWSAVLKSIFVGANLEVVSKNVNENISSFYLKAKNKALEVNKTNLPIWDLILLDLRLDESEDLGESANKKASDFTGAKLLKEIKKANQGTQVIMFTASNKAWNMRDLMGSGFGANGFFIKEAPEYNQDQTFSIRNFESFENQAIECFERKFLREICNINSSIRKVLDLQDKLSDRLLSKNRKLVRVYLTLAFNSIANYTTISKEYALYSFLEFYKILEILGNELVDKKKENEKTTAYIIKGKASKKIEFISLTPSVTSEIEPVKDPNNSNNIVGYQKGVYHPTKDELKYYTKPTSFLRLMGLMLLRFSFDTSQVNTFMELNKLRNGVVAHSAEKNKNAEITIEDVLKLAKILNNFFKQL